MSGSDAKVIGATGERFDEVLTPDAIAFVTDLQRKFGKTRDEFEPDRSNTISCSRSSSVGRSGSCRNGSSRSLARSRTRRRSSKRCSK